MRQTLKISKSMLHKWYSNRPVNGIEALSFNPDTGDATDS